MREITVKKNDAGQRLDKFLTKAVKGLPTSMMYKLIRTKKIKVNRKRAEQKYILCEGDTVQLFIREEFFDSPEKDDGALSRIVPKLSIVYEDENIILLNKRPGVLVHEDTEAAENTLIMHMKAYLYQKGEYDPTSEQSFAPALCNRIDRNTGGIVIGAKNAEALRVMNEKIRDGQMNKFYLCLVHGVPKKKEDKLYAFLRKDSKNNTVEVRNSPFPGAKEIITGYRVLDVRDGNALLEVELFTGRTHQIRAQMAAIGHPLIGDGKYGINRADKQKGYKYQALYAYKLRFAKTGEENLLSYLEGKSFSLDRADIWFLNE
ncbi:MAG: RluA family pseudouridine synthase [Clostridia bacterium]|nr:RluA family pseudouridine synthase [Clostridia bacterium]